MNNYLVIGNGVISNAIRKHLPNVTHIGRPAFDIRDDPLHDHIQPTQNGTAIICAAIPQIETCQKYPTWTRSINVIATTQIARTLHRNGYNVILLSTGAVKAHPPTEYGQQKRDLEEIWINNQYGPILRLPKVLTAELPLIKQWMQLLKNNQTLNPYRTIQIQPIDPRDAALAIDSVSIQKNGIYEAAGQTVTWVTVARLLATYCGSESDIIPIYDGEQHPLLTKTKLVMCGWQSPPIELVMKRVFTEWKLFHDAT